MRAGKIEEGFPDISPQGTEPVQLPFDLLIQDSAPRIHVSVEIGPLKLEGFGAERAGEKAIVDGMVQTLLNGAEQRPIHPLPC